MSTVFNVQADVLTGYKESKDIISSVLTVGLSDDVHPVVVSYLDHLGNWLGASPRSMQTVRAAVCLHGCATLRKLGLMVGIKPIDTARLLADCSGGVAWLTWEAALLECFSHDDVASFQQEAGRLIGLKSVPVPHMRELVSALDATAPRLGTVSFPEHYAKLCGAMRQALFAATDVCPPAVAEPPLMSDMVELLVRVAEAYREQTPVIIQGQRSIGWLAATLTWIYGEGVEVISAGRVIQEADTRANMEGHPPLIAVELCEYESALLVLAYRMEREELVATLTTQPRQDTLASFGPKRSRADEYYANWLNCTSPVGPQELRPLTLAASQFTVGLLRTIHVTNEGGDNGFQAETQGTGKQLVNVLKLPASISDVSRVRDFFKIPTHAWDATRPIPPPQPTSQMQIMYLSETGQGREVQPVIEGGSTTALAFLSTVPSLREVYGRMIREMLKAGICGSNECSCILPGTGPETLLPSAHEQHCGVYSASSLAVELIATCICSLFIEAKPSPRLTMFHTSPLRWAISKAIEQSVLTGSALISGADLMKSVLVVAGYAGDYGYGPLIISTGGQALVLGALYNMNLSPDTVGRIFAFPGAIIHRNQYYSRLVVGRCRQAGGGILRTVGDSSLQLDPAARHVLTASAEGAADSTSISIRETINELQLVLRSQQFNGTIKEHDLWHCITSALAANMLGDCKHTESRSYALKAGELIKLVGTGTNLGEASRDLNAGLTIAMVHQKPFDRLLACGTNVNMVVQTAGCLHCAVSACKQLGYSYIVC